MLTRTRPRLFVSDRGSGEIVLLITGWTISSAVFDPVAGLYLPRVRVIAYDHRGSGRSARWAGPVSMATLAADAARVLEERRVEAAHVVGLSMGAAVAIELAVRMPHRVKSLVVVGGGAGGPSTALGAFGPAASAAGAVVADSIARGGLWPAALLFSERFRQEQPDRVAQYLPYFARHRAPAWVAAWQALAVACYGRRSSLRKIRAPTLAIHGEEDVMVAAENARVLGREIPSAQTWVVPGVGHAVPLERPAETAELILGWVARNAEVPVTAPARRDVAIERVTRPLSLLTGTLRNVADLRRVPGLAPPRAFGHSAKTSARGARH